MNKRKAVVAGAGGISDAWFPRLKKEGVEVVGVSDLDQQKAHNKISQHELSADAGTDIKPLIEKHGPDFVVDLTIPEAHCEITCTALEMGCHVIGEKPMANSPASARKMIEASEKSGKLYMVSQSRRYDGMHAQIKELIAASKLGNLTTINCDFYIGAHFGGFRDEMNSPLILDMSIHHFDLLRMLSGCDPVAVYAHEFNPFGSWYKGDAAASCIFEMSNGLVFTYRGSWCAEGCFTSWHGDWRMIGTEGTLKYEKEQMSGEIVKKRGGFHSEFEPLNIEPKPSEYPAQHGAVREFLNYLDNGTIPQGECHDNYKSLMMVFSAMESARLGCRVQIETK